MATATALNNAPIEELHKLFQNASRTNSDIVQDALEQDLIKQFAKKHPEVARTAANGKQIQHWFDSRRLKAQTLEHVEEAYEDLKQYGLIEMNQAYLDEQYIKQHGKR